MDNIEQLLPHWIKRSGKFSVVVTDLEGKYIYVNQTFKERFSWLSDHFIGEPFSNSVHPGDMEKCNQAAKECIMNPGKIVNLTIRKPANSKGVYEQSDWEFSLFENEKGEPVGIMSLGYDTTSLRQFSETVTRYEMQMAKIANTQSHEVRGPLTSIMGLVDLMLNDDKVRNDEKHFNLLLETCNKLDKVIHQVVKLSDK
jgi:PAS domain S-box-containing protein